MRIAGMQYTSERLMTRILILLTLPHHLNHMRIYTKRAPEYSEALRYMLKCNLSKIT